MKRVIIMSKIVKTEALIPFVPPTLFVFDHFCAYFTCFAILLSFPITLWYIYIQIYTFSLKMLTNWKRVQRCKVDNNANVVQAKHKYVKCKHVNTWKRTLSNETKSVRLSCLALVHQLSLFLGCCECEADSHEVPYSPWSEGFIKKCVEQLR